MNWAWAILEFLPGRRPQDSRRPDLFFGLTVPFFERRTIPAGARVHRSVVGRAKAAGRPPPNLPPDRTIED